MARRASAIIAMFIMGAVFILIGGGLAFYVGKPTLDKAKASAAWPTTIGKIVQSELERRRGKKDSNYEAVVVFEYAVDGEEHQGDEIWFGQYSSSDRLEMQKLVSQYSVGAAVDVYYSPVDHSTAVLQPGAFTSTYMPYWIGLLFLGVGCLLLAAPLIKLFVLTAVVATSSSDSFAGGGSTSGGSEFSSDGFHPENLDDHDSDGFDGIPES